MDNDIVEHEHGPTTHTHAWGSTPHGHFMRAVCSERECEGYPTHNIHPKPKTVEVWSCIVCGPSIHSRYNWCDRGCGRDFNKMSRVEIPLT